MIDKNNEHIQAIAEHVTKEGLNYFGAEFEYIETGEAFTVTVAKESVLRKLTEENARLRELAESMLNLNMELINDYNKRVPPWDCIDMEHIHDGFKLLKGDEDE